MRVTVCELPHTALELEAAWNALRAHVQSQETELLVLPEFAFVEPVWLQPSFDVQRWDAQSARFDAWLQRLPELGVAHVIGAGPRTRGGLSFNEGFHWSAQAGYRRLRNKHHLPLEEGGWEAAWFTRGEADFGNFEAGALRFGLNICTELWALETYAGYAASTVHAVVSPRATAAATTQKWLALGQVAAVRSGAFSISSNRVHADGSCGGVGWIIDPDGQTLARTSAAEPFATVALDLQAAARARGTYPRYVFGAG